MESHSVSGKRGFICAMGLFFVVVAGEKSYTIFYFRETVYEALFLHAMCLKFVLWACLYLHDVHVDYCRVENLDFWVFRCTLNCLK